MARIPSNPALRAHFLHAQDPKNPFYSTPLSGKWCMKFDEKAIDEAWGRIEALVDAGKIRAAIVSTVWSSRAQGFDTQVICVFTDDWRDYADVKRVREVLSQEGFLVTMGYKRDIDTVSPSTGPEFIYTDENFPN